VNISPEPLEPCLPQAPKCAYCGNFLIPNDYVENSVGALCCSAACVTLSEEPEYETVRAIGRCTNCEAQLHASSATVFSHDGLKFCSAECIGEYPRAASSPEVRRALWGASLGLLLVTVGVLVWLTDHFGHKH